MHSSEPRFSGYSPESLARLRADLQDYLAVLTAVHGGGDLRSAVRSAVAFVQGFTEPGTKGEPETTRGF